LLFALHASLVPAQSFYETVGVIKDMFTAGVNFAGDATGLFGQLLLLSAVRRIAHSVVPHVAFAERCPYTNNAVEELTKVLKKYVGPAVVGWLLYLVF
jgi:hypothetical protein